MLVIGLGVAFGIFIYEVISGFVTAWMARSEIDKQWREYGEQCDRQKEFYDWHKAAWKGYGEPDA
jgi:hypothetical protein